MRCFVPNTSELTFYKLGTPSSCCLPRDCDWQLEGVVDINELDKVDLFLTNMVTVCRRGSE
jgi:hypothetical protein